MSTNSASHRFTTTHIAALKSGPIPRDVADPGVPGLVLRVSPGGSKRWLFRFKWKGVASRMALGKYPELGLADARNLALQYRDLLNRGIDPRRAERRHGRTRLDDRSQTAKAADAPSSCADADHEIPEPHPEDRHSVLFLAYEYVKHYVKPNRERPADVARVLKKDVLPRWCDRDARTIKGREVIELLDAIVERGARIMANRTAKILGQMFKYGIHREIVEDSPVKLLYLPGGKEKSRSRVFSQKELTAFVQQGGKVSISKKRTHTLMVLLLTLQRRGELALAEWKEFDFAAKEWHVPAKHDKMRRGHIVPLTDWAIAELMALKALCGASRFVLPNRRGDRPSSPQLISRSVQRLQKRFQAIGIATFTPHDLRRTGRTELGRLKVPPNIAERVINHSKEVIEGTYDLYEYLPEKRDALEKWERRLLQLQSIAPATEQPIQLPKKARRRRERIEPGIAAIARTTSVGVRRHAANATRVQQRPSLQPSVPSDRGAAPFEQHCLEFPPVTAPTPPTTSRS